MTDSVTSIHSDGVVKLNYGQRGDVVGGLGPNPWQFSLAANTEVQINPTLPSVISSSTRWSDFVRAEDDTELFVTDATYATRFIEQNIDRQIHAWRIIVDYERSDASTDEQVLFRLHNPISLFSLSSSFQLLRGNLIAEGKADLITIADGASIPENGLGAGYQLFVESTSVVDISIRSITRISNYESRGVAL